MSRSAHTRYPARKRRPTRHLSWFARLRLNAALSSDEALVALNEIAPPPAGRHEALREWLVAA